LNIQVTQDKLDTLNFEIQTLKINIGQKEFTIERQKVIIAELIRNLAHNDNQSYVQILASYNSFSDLYNELHSLQTIEEDVGKSIKSIRVAKEDLQLRKKQTEDKKAEIVVLEQTLEEQKNDLDDQKAVKQRLLSQTRSSEKIYNSLLSSLKNQYQQTENEISVIEKQVRSKLTEKQRIELLQGADATKLSWPTPSHRITAYFHDPDYPFRYIFEHPAIDIRAPQGTIIRAAASGYVAQSRRCSTSSCYAYIMIIHNDGISTLYGHMSRIDVSIDQFVTRGDAIGLSGGRPGTIGAGPFVTGPHLHFEVRKGGIPQDPQLYLIQ
jgi:murein DD-endopeptidase MepM/ murein hydrolase activator NlpD